MNRMPVAKKKVYEVKCVHFDNFSGNIFSNRFQLQNEQ